MKKLELLSKITGIEIEGLKSRKDLKKDYKALYEEKCTDKEKLDTIFSLVQKIDVKRKSNHRLGLKGEIDEAFAQMLEEKGYSRREARNIRRDTLLGNNDTHGYYEFAINKLEEIARTY